MEMSPNSKKLGARGGRLFTPNAVAITTRGEHYLTNHALARFFKVSTGFSNNIDIL